jgi:hypothetical protein
MGPIRQQQQNLPHSMRGIRAVAANPPVVVKKARKGGLFGLTWPFAFISLAFSTSPAS